MISGKTLEQATYCLETDIFLDYVAENHAKLQQLAVMCTKGLIDDLKIRMIQGESLKHLYEKSNCYVRLCIIKNKLGDFQKEIDSFKTSFNIYDDDRYDNTDYYCD